jgi:formylglycine-generating enzyme required for sulfatase activity
VPAGEASIGSTAWQVGWLALRRFGGAAAERPQHRVPVAGFAIARYPVTRAEYACFIAGGGYDEERYWDTAAGRAWRRGEGGEEGPLRAWMEAWRAFKVEPSRLERRDFTPRARAQWKQLIEMEEGEVRQILGRAYGERRRDQPAFWEDSRFDSPAQPVVGVTWYEARAYCRWLEARLASWGGWGTVDARLPSEVEWEWAARGRRRRIYPWGRRWDPERANTWEGHVLRPTPVGVYPGGATPGGIHDLSGNVWEWTSSLYRPYPYHADDGREDPEAEGARVLRGGSWDDASRLARCAFRNGDVPGNWNGIVGFRVVFSPGSRSGC